MSTNQFALLKTARFLPLFITQFLSTFAQNTFKIALLIFIAYKLTDLSNLSVQILITFAAAILIFPAFLFSAVAGQLADKYEKSFLMSCLQFTEILCAGMAAIGFYTESISLLLFVLFALGAHAAFFTPLKYAALPNQLTTNELIAGNGLIEAGTFLAILFGTACGGIFIMQPHGEAIVTTLLLIVAVTSWLTSLYIPRSIAENPTLEMRYDFIDETFQQIKFSQRRWDIILSILALSWFWFVGGTVLAEFPVFAKHDLHANSYVAIYFVALFSLGLGIGALCCHRLLKGKVEATYVPLGALGMSLFCIDLYFAASHISEHLASDRLTTVYEFLRTPFGWRVSIDLFFIAISGGIYTVPLYTMLQYRAAPAHRARIMASNNVMNSLFMVVAAFTTMLVLKIGFTVTELFLFLAITNGIVAVYICKLLPDVLIRGFFHWLLTTLYRVKVKGLENYENAGQRVVIVANHTSFIDALLLATFLPDKLTFAVNTLTAKKWWIKFFLSLVDAYEVDPTNPMALKALIEFVEKDKRCVIFPEGRTTTTGALMKIYEAPGLVADKSGAELLPIRIQGAQHTPFSRLKGKTRILWMPHITITIFPSQPLDIPEKIKGRKRRQQIGYRLYDVMTEMMFESSDYHRTLFDGLIDAKTLHGPRYEIVEDIERAPMTYQQLVTRSFILGHLVARNTSMGEYVGVLLPNANSNLVMFFGLHAYCRIPAMLNYSTGPSNIVSACKTAQIHTVYTSRKFVSLGKLTDITDALDKAGIRIIYLEDLRSKVTTIDKLRGFLFGLFPRMCYRMINRSATGRALRTPEATAVVLFTSGSEGLPKGVVLSHSNMQANRYQMMSCIDFSVNDTALNALPMFHSFGLTAGTMLPVLSGVKLFLYPSPLHYRIVPELAYDINATIFFGTDTFLTGYAKYAHPYDFFSLRYIFAGAEKLRDETRNIWAMKFGIRIFEGYGTTETSPVISSNTPMQNKIGTVGRIFPGMRYRIKPVPGIAEGGVLMISGPNVMQGYLLAGNPGVLQPPEDGWYDTGDVVTLDDASFITIKGRVKRFAKVAGEMISLAMVEQYLNQLWPAYQHVVINMPDAKKGEQLVLLTTNPDASRPEIISFAKKQGIAEIAIPKNIITTETMPLLGSGKIDYPGARKIVEDNFIPETDESEDELED